MRKKAIIAFLGAMFALVPLLTLGAGKFQYAGWIPFWKQQAGAADTAINLEKLQEISPFSYEVLSNGTMKDDLKINEGFWPGWLSAARDAKIKILPTIAWFDGNAMHALLSSAKRRQAHEDAIAKLVKDQNFDGIDIDYESKLSATKNYFSTFLQGLAMRLHPKGKLLSCTIEARTPLASLENSDKPQNKPSYANDYAAINKYCDEVRIMAYDQGTIDLKLDATKGNGNLYAPVADPDWVKKVLQETVKTISPKKIMLAIPTYGYEYQVSWVNGLTLYERLRSHTFFQAMNRAEAIGTMGERNSAGELSFWYVTSTLVADVSSALTSEVSSVFPPALANANTSSSVERLVSWSDASSAAQKIALAKKMGLRGAVFFKLDGEQDPLIWDLMK